MIDKADKPTTTATGGAKKNPAVKPRTLPVLPDGIPIVLAALSQWIRWRWEWSESRKSWTKIPIHPFYSQKASTTNRSTWGPFEIAVSNLGSDDVDGIGFVFTATDPFLGVDLDDCRDSETGEIGGEARRIVNELQGYCEISPSGTGLHIIVRASLGDLGGKRTGPLEIYDRARYFAVTGHPLVLPEACP